MLAQYLAITRKEQVIYYVNKKLSPYKVNYTPLQKSYAALVWVTHKFRHYMLVFPVTLVSRIDPLKYLFEKPALSNHMEKWLFMLSQFDITYMTHKSVKGKIIANYLASNPMLGGIIEKANFLDHAIMSLEVHEDWKMYFDGATNQNGNGIWVLLISPDQTHSTLPYILDFFVHQ